MTPPKAWLVVIPSLGHAALLSLLSLQSFAPSVKNTEGSVSKSVERVWGSHSFWPGEFFGELAKVLEDLPKWVQD